jgi:hypothetical protein
MGDESRSGKAIIPDDKSRELALPAEMIHRGLELAVRIERKQGIQPVAPSSITAECKSHLVRSHLSFMEWYQTPDGSRKLREPEKKGSYLPIFLWLSFDMDGIHISCVPESEKSDLMGIQGNADRYRLLNAFNDINPFTIPVPSFVLFYTLTFPLQKDQLPPGPFPHLPPKEEWKKVSYTMCPSGQPGYKGPVTKEANPYFDINRDCVQNEIIYIAMLKDSDKKQECVSKNPPIKLTFIVIDPNGENDPTVTRELYHSMLDARNRIKPT